MLSYSLWFVLFQLYYQVPVIYIPENKEPRVDID